MATIRVKDRFNKNNFENNAWAENKLICGIDEVGRGCLAGPVVVAAVVLFPNKLNRQLRDSKLMLAQEREKAALWIKKNSWFSIALAHHRTIDLYNIYHATLIAMKRAFMQITTHTPKIPEVVVVDAMPLNIDTIFPTTTVYHFPFGERRSSSIAAASILAKVTRDRLMARHFETIVPGYNFASHKGYATPEHKKNVQLVGHSIIHRINYLSHIYSESCEAEDQQMIISEAGCPDANVLEMSTFI